MCIITLMRKFMVLLVLFLGVVFVIVSFSELEQTVATLKQGNFWYILLAFLIQIGWFFLVGITYRSIYHLLGMEESILNLTQVAVAAIIFAYCQKIRSLTILTTAGGTAQTPDN